MLSKCLLTAAFLAAGLPSGALAQSYPVKPIRVVVPLVPGGNLDIVARAVSQRLSEGLGQQVIVENRPGASSLVGTQLVAKSPADGYTLLAMANTFTAVPAVIANPGYDPVRDFTGVSLTCKVAQVLVINPSLPVKSVKDLVALAKARPGATMPGCSRCAISVSRWVATPPSRAPRSRCTPATRSVWSVATARARPRC